MLRNVTHGAPVHGVDVASIATRLFAETQLLLGAQQRVAINIHGDASTKAQTTQGSGADGFCSIPIVHNAGHAQLAVSSFPACQYATSLRGVVMFDEQRGAAILA